MIRIHPISRALGVGDKQEEKEPEEAENNIKRDLRSDGNMKIKNLRIKKSRCNEYIPNDRGICGCGLSRNQHEQSALDNYSGLKDKKWTPEKSTIEDRSTDAYGSIRFNNNKELVSKFIRVGQFTKQEKMQKVLFSCWKLEKPKLLISVTGGALNFNLKPKLRDVFRKGLIKAAVSTNAWISTGGTNAGVMKHVGEAIYNTPLSPNQKFVVLGIANWCTVKDNDQLIKKDWNNENETFDYNSNLTNDDPRIKSAPLNPYHSHFILVDNSEQNKYGGEIEFRGSLEKAIVNYMQEDNETPRSSETPIVVLVVEGGPNTLLTVLNSVKNGSPCVFIEGSGKCADLFAFAISKLTIRDESSKKETLRPLNDELRREIENKIRAIWKDKDVNEIMVNIEQTLKYSHLLTVYRLVHDEIENDIDIAILRSLLKAKKDNYKAQLKLCLTWNRIDIAKNFIFTDEKIWQGSDLNDLMYFAIANDRVDFVKIFDDNGCDMSQFLTYRRLTKLYNDIPRSGMLFKVLVKNKRNKSKDYSPNVSIKLKEIGEAIQEFTSNIFKHEFTKRPINQIITEKTKLILAQTDEYGNKNFINFDQSLKTDVNYFDIDRICDNPDHEMFMYCVLTEKTQMAKIFWDRGTNKICSALIASTVFNSYANLAEDEENNYTETSDEFEKMATDILQQCFAENQDDALMVLLRQIPEFGNSTALQIAYVSDDKTFVSSACYQLLLAKLWYGQIYLDAPALNILLATCLPIFAPFIVNLENDKSKLNLEALAENSDKNELEKLTPKNEDLEMRLVEDDQNQNDPTPETYQEISYLTQLSYFFRAPFIKFIYNQIAFALFLGLFSYVILCDFYPIRHVDEESGFEIGQEPGIPEFILIAWVTTFLIDEIRQFMNVEAIGTENRMARYFSDFWNVVHTISILLFIIGVVLRFIPDYQVYLAARILLCVDVVLWFFRSLYGYSFIRVLGPKLVMIRRMLNELVFFMFIVVIFIFAYGVATQALMYHNQELNLTLLKNVFFPAYFVIGGEYYEREKLMQEEDSCEANLTDKILYDEYSQDDCPEQYGTNVSLGLFVGYLIMLNILLVNLLIAIFSNAYEEVEKEADKIWKFQRYSLVYQYFNKPVLPTPLTIFYYIYKLLRFFIRNLLSLCIEFKQKKQIFFWSAFLTSSEKDRLRAWEDFIAEDYIIKSDAKSKETQDFKIQTSLNKVELVNSKLDEMSEDRQNMMNKIAELNDKVDMLVKMLAKKNDISLSTASLGDERAKRSTVMADASVIRVDTGRQFSSANTGEYRTFQSVENDEPLLREEYLGTGIIKGKVSQSRISWDVNYDKYAPTNYTSPNVLASIEADTDLLKIPAASRTINFNSFDDVYLIDRRSCLGQYVVQNGLPLNPQGRTGIMGRGDLLYWGPNYVYELAFTRFRMKNDGEFTIDRNGKRIIEILVIQNQTEWSLPSVIQKKNIQFLELIQEEIINEIFQLEKANYKDMLSLLKNPITLSKYFKISEANTDNAWYEFVLVNFHDKGNKILSKVAFKNKQNMTIVWKDIQETISQSTGSDATNLKKIFNLHQA